MLQIAFVGTAYAGWQRQKNGLGIQEVVERAVAAVTGQSSSVTGCSRTDAGVHAEQYYANFLTSSAIPADRFSAAIQSHLPGDVLLKKSREVGERFHARRDALEKTYRYQIYLGRSPFLNDRWWQCQLQLNRRALAPLADEIVGDHDFSGFCVRRSLKSGNRCLVSQATWRCDGRKLYFRISGNRFLHRMVRFLVGAQVEVASGKHTAAEFRSIVQHPAEHRALYAAPPEGLYLNRVKY